MILVEIAAWIWEHKGEVTLNAILLLILRKFVIHEMHKLFHFGREGEVKWLIEKVEGLTGEKYDLQPAFLRTAGTRYINSYYFYLRKVIKHLNPRRKKKMNALKSTKFWLAIIGAIIPVINNELGINLDSNTILGILGLFATAIAGIAHVDAKKAQNVGTVSEPAKPTGDSGQAV